MTIIVKTKSPETSDEVISDYLTELLGTLTFKHFEAITSGEVTLLGTTFYMRIGTFLGVPTQAIIAEEQFVKMQQRTDIDTTRYELKPLDPKDPSSCFYPLTGQSGANQWFPHLRLPPQDSHITRIQKLIEQYEAEKQKCLPDGRKLRDLENFIKKEQHDRYHTVSFSEVTRDATITNDATITRYQRSY